MKNMANGKGSNPGVKPALGRNPNTHSNLNEAPEGPGAHSMGLTGDGGMKGDASVKTGRGSFVFD